MTKFILIWIYSPLRKARKPILPRFLTQKVCECQNNFCVYVRHKYNMYIETIFMSRRFPRKMIKKSTLSYWLKVYFCHMTLNSQKTRADICKQNTGLAGFCLWHNEAKAFLKLLLNLHTPFTLSNDILKFSQFSPHACWDVVYLHHYNSPLVSFWPTLQTPPL